MFLKPPFDSVPNLILPCRIALSPKSSVQESPLVEPAHMAVGDRNGFTRLCISKSERAFEADSVVVWRVDAAVRDVYIATAIDIHSVPVGIDNEVVDGEMIDAGSENSKPSAMANGDISYQYILTIYERDRFVAVSGRFRVVGDEPLPEDLALADDRDIRDVISPYQAVVKVRVPEILVLIVDGWFGRIIGNTFSRRSRDKSCPGCEF